MSSTRYCGAMQRLGFLASRIVVVSGGASCADTQGVPMRPATPADESVVRKQRRLSVEYMAYLLSNCRQPSFTSQTTIAHHRNARTLLRWGFRADLGQLGVMERQTRRA